MAADAGHDGDQYVLRWSPMAADAGHDGDQ